MTALVSVALPLPLFRPLMYAVPEALAARVAVGSRVVVPVRGRREIGFVVGEGETRNGLAPKLVLEAPDSVPVVDQSLLAVCRWISEYYAAPLGVVLRTALPGALTGPESPVPSPKTRRVAEIARELPTLVEREQTFARSKKQRELYELLETLGGSE